MKRKEGHGFLIQILLRHKLWVSVMLLLAVALGVLSLIIPVYMQRVVDSVVAGAEISRH